jgi:hypothetical protein
MSDDILIATGEYVPIQDTVCECGHWYEEHEVCGPCNAPGCECAMHLADPNESTAEAIAWRGGDPSAWPEHVRRAEGVRE